MARLSSKFLLLGSAAAILVTSLFSSHIVPLYDGVGFPDEPYRYVKPPTPAKKTPLPPSPAETIAEFSKGTNGSDLNLASHEQGPQVNIYVFSYSLQDSRPTDQVDFTVTPQAPNSKPSAGAIAGDVYHFAAKGSGRLTFGSNMKYAGYIDLRLPQGYPVGALFVYRSSASSKWRTLDTNRVGNDIYEAHLVGFGDYAITSKPGSVAPKRIVSPLLFALVAVFAVLIIILAAIRYITLKPRKKKR